MERGPKAGVAAGFWLLAPASKPLSGRFGGCGSFVARLSTLDSRQGPAPGIVWRDMLKHLMVVAIVATGCSSKSKPTQPSDLQWQLPKNQSLVYRVTAESRAVSHDDGQAKEEGGEKVTDYIFVDVDGDGNASIVLEEGKPIFGVTSAELRSTASNFFFPLPSRRSVTARLSSRSPSRVGARRPIESTRTSWCPRP